MCTQLITIRSNAKRYRPLLSRGQLAVPCGHCPECISQKQDEWFLRLWQEIQDYNMSGGKCIFMTLTYNNESLPIYHDIAKYVSPDTGVVYDADFRIPCFSKKHKDRFMNSLLKWFERHGITGDTSKGIRYIWPCEYGMSEFATHRPHYHPILLLPSEAVSLFKSERELKSLIERLWKYGFVRWSKPEDGGIFVDSEFAARYVTKYVIKDIEFFSQPQVNAYLYDVDGNLIKDRWERFKPFAPHHWQSKSFGLSLTKYCEDDSVFEDGLPFNFIQDIKQGKDKVWRVPSYIERKLLYKDEPYFYHGLDDDGEPNDMWFVHHSLVLNERGKRVKGQKFGFDYKLEKLVIHNSDLCKVENYRKYSGPNYRSDYLNSLLDLLQGKSWRYFSAWQLAFRGTLFDTDHKDLCQAIRHMNEDQFVSFCRFLYDERIRGYDIDDFFSIDGFLWDKKCPKHIDLENFSLFYCFSRLDSLLLQLRDDYSKECYRQYKADRQRRKELKVLTG